MWTYVHIIVYHLCKVIRLLCLPIQGSLKSRLKPISAAVFEGQLVFLAFKELLFYFWVTFLLLKNQILTLTSPKAYVPEMVFWIQIFENLLNTVISNLFIGLIIKLAIYDEYHTSSQDVMVTEVFVYSS